MNPDQPYEPITECGAEWDFDTCFGVYCQLRVGHFGRHHADQPGNGGVVATISWSKR